MVTSELLIKLIEGHYENNESKFREIVNLIIKQEKDRGNTRTASKIKKATKTSSTGFSFSGLRQASNSSTSQEFSSAAFDIIYPSLFFEDIALSDKELSKLKTLLVGIKSLDSLRSWGIDSFSKALFIGPPGTGKTLAAQVIASELNYGIQYVRLDLLISSYLGETGKNIREVFDYGGSGDPLIVFLDEFDAIAKKRDDTRETGEIKRVVNTLIQNIDLADQNKIVIAATNHPELLDDALWRRFDTIIEFPYPSLIERKKILRIHTKHLPLDDRVDLNLLAELSDNFTGSEIAQWVKLASLNAVIDRKRQVDCLSFARAFLELEDLLRLRNRFEIREHDKSRRYVNKKVKLLNELGLSFEKIGKGYGFSTSSAWRRATTKQ